MKKALFVEFFLSFSPKNKLIKRLNPIIVNNTMMRYLQANVFCVYQGGEKIPRKYFEKKERKTEIDKLLKMRHVALAFC